MSESKAIVKEIKEKPSKNGKAEEKEVISLEVNIDITAQDFKNLRVIFDWAASAQYLDRGKLATLIQFESDIFSKIEKLIKK